MDIEVEFHSPKKQRYGNAIKGYENSNCLDTELFSY